MELTLPSHRVLTALCNIYLVLSLCVINVIAADRPTARLGHSDRGADTWRDGGEAREARVSGNDIIEEEDSAVIQERALSVQDYDYEELFRPSSQLEDSYGQRLESRVDAGRERRRETERPRLKRQRSGARRQGQVRESPYRKADKVPYRQPPYRRADQSLYRQRQRPETSPYSTLHENRYQEPPRRIQFQKQPAAPARTQRPIVGLSGFDYYDDTYTGVLEPASPANKPNILNSLFSLIKPKTPKRPVEVEQSRPSWQFVTEENEIDVGEKVSAVSSTGGEQFIPNTADYEDYNINYLDQEEEPAYPQYTLKDVIYSIKNNESRILTLKKFLSAASAMTDRAGTDPVFMLWSMPLTILSFLGVFYALSASAVLVYKYVLLTSGSSNGQAVAILPVVLLFVVPIVLVTVFLIARGALDGQINMGHLARGDLKNGFRHDFESVDFAYDLGVGATALLGLGWMVSITL